MSQLTSYTISAGILGVFNIEIDAPNPETALTLAKTDWLTHGSANWTPCGPAEIPHFQVEEETDIPDTVPANSDLPTEEVKS